jgi:hypothetical protein
VVRIWIRATMDFDDEAAFRAQLEPRLREPIALWDATFAMPWRVFRSRLRAVARESLERVEGAVVAEWEEIPEGSLVLPCDDDDWFRPDVAKVVQAALAPNHTGVRWQSTFLEVPRDWRHHLGIWRRHVQGPRPRFVCTTNNYAVVVSRAPKPVLTSHLEASDWFLAQPAAAVAVLDDRLSLQNRTIASQTALVPQQRTIGRRHLLRKLDRYRRLYDRPLAPELAWAQPYADQMASLMRELTLRA